MEEVDEFGIPIKKQATTEVAVDEFGIPVKKKRTYHNYFYKFYRACSAAFGAACIAFKAEWNG